MSQNDNEENIEQPTDSTDNILVDEVQEEETVEDLLYIDLRLILVVPTISSRSDMVVMIKLGTFFFPNKTYIKRVLKSQSPTD
jgi:hypothetical protein